MRFCALCVLISIFCLAVKVSSVFGMTQHKERCFGFRLFFFPSSICLLCNDFFNMYTAKIQLLEGEREAVGNVMLCQIKNY